MDFIRLYCFYVKTFFKARAEYRVSFFLGFSPILSRIFLFMCHIGSLPPGWKGSTGGSLKI